MSTINEAHLYSILSQVSAYYQAKGCSIPVDELWGFVKRNQTSPAVSFPGATCPRKIQKDGRICGRALVPGLTVCKIHSPKVNDPARALCKRVKPASKGGGLCGRQVYKNKDGTFEKVCQYHRFDPPSPKKKVETEDL